MTVMRSIALAALSFALTVTVLVAQSRLFDATLIG